jgi:Uma2 family endonuclease
LSVSVFVNIQDPVYINRHSQPDDIYLIVESTTSTIKYDCEVKDKIYPKANITDYWVIDIPHKQVHILGDPTPTSYTSHLILAEPQTVSPLALPGIELWIGSILPPI